MTTKRRLVRWGVGRLENAERNYDPARDEKEEGYSCPECGALVGNDAEIIAAWVHVKGFVPTLDDGGDLFIECSNREEGRRLTCSRIFWFWVSPTFFDVLNGDGVPRHFVANFYETIPHEGG